MTTSVRQQCLQVRMGSNDRDRLRQLMEREELTASALVRRLIREKVSELGLEPEQA